MDRTMSTITSRAVSRRSPVDPGYSTNARIKMVVDRGIDHDVRSGHDARGEVLGQQPVVVEWQMRAVLLRLCTERNHDDGRGVEQLLGFGPRQCRDTNAASAAAALRGP